LVAVEVEKGGGVSHGWVSEGLKLPGFGGEVRTGKGPARCSHAPPYQEVTLVAGFTQNSYCIHRKFMVECEHK
jgi:hypothetical protein